MKDHSRENRNEFDWEQEIRRDERRISRYYRELAYCLDLPGEDDIIYEQLSGRCSDPVFAAANQLYKLPFERNDEEEEDENPPPHRLSHLAARIDRLAASWCILSVARLRRQFFAAGGMAIACAYAKLLARVSDFDDADPETEPALRLSLAKRALADINDLLGAMREISTWQENLQSELKHHVDGLFFIREELTKIVAAG